MWRRSEVELLTGLERHVIQNLCNKNTSRDGLGFWDPAVMKPGYSRFDEGDLCMFYLVRQLMKVGFVPSEMSSVVRALLEEDCTFTKVLKKRARALEVQRLQVESQISAAKRLERVVTCRPEERLYAVMGCEVLASVARAVGAAAERLGATPEEAGRAHACLRMLTRELLCVVWGNQPNARAEALSDCLSELLASGVDPSSPEAVVTLRRALCKWNSSGFESEGVDCTCRFDALFASALAAFLKERENGVPVELSLGKGSFLYLGQVAATYASRLERLADSGERA